MMKSEAPSSSWSSATRPSSKRLGGKLILAGVNPKVMKQLKATETSQDILGDEDVFIATKIYRQSLDAAIAAAQEWLKAQAEGSESK